MPPPIRDVQQQEEEDGDRRQTVTESRCRHCMRTGRCIGGPIVAIVAIVIASNCPLPRRCALPAGAAISSLDPHFNTAKIA